MFKDTSIDIYQAEDMALPFWIYFVSGNGGIPKDRLMVRLFEKCEEESRDVNKALFEVILDAYGPAASFFQRFALERKDGFWQKPSSQSCNYTRILGPDGKDFVNEIKRYQRERLELSLRSTKAP